VSLRRLECESRKTMASGEAYFLVYTNTFKRHLKLVPAKYHSLIRKTLEEQLEYDPTVRTRNRKPLKKPLAFNAEWELRFGPDNSFRVFYTVEGENVILLAFGEKTGNRLWIEGEEVET
jgi:mRNA-degrading endonuclease RelE of RelBE toxin-antitoxin system